MTFFLFFVKESRSRSREKMKKEQLHLPHTSQRQDSDRQLINAAATNEPGEGREVFFTKAGEKKKVGVGREKEATFSSSLFSFLRPPPPHSKRAAELRLLRRELPHSPRVPELASALKLPESRLRRAYRVLDHSLLSREREQLLVV